MASKHDMSVTSSSSSEDLGEDIHAFEEEEEINVSSLKEELMAEFKKGMEAELNDMRLEVNKLRAERDRAVREVQQLRELLNARTSGENIANNSINARTPPRKVAKVWTEPNRQSSASSTEFPALPTRPAAESGHSAKPKISNPFASASAVRDAAAPAASASTSRGAAAKVSVAAAANTNANEVSNYKKIMQAIDTNVFKVRLVLIDARVNNFR